MECCSRERDNHVHRPGREGGQGISMTRIFRGVWVPAFWKKGLWTASSPSSHTHSLLLLLHFPPSGTLLPQTVFWLTPLPPSGLAFPSRPV